MCASFFHLSFISYMCCHFRFNGIRLIGGIVIFICQYKEKHNFLTIYGGFSEDVPSFINQSPSMQHVILCHLP